jgi:hypothetical protein
MALSWSGHKKVISSEKLHITEVFKRDLVVNFAKVALLGFATFSTFATPLYSHKSSQTPITIHNCPEFFQFQQFAISSDDIGWAFPTPLKCSDDHLQRIASKDKFENDQILNDYINGS